MIVEIVLKNEPNIDIEGYKKLELQKGTIFVNPVEKRVEIVVKRHPDGKISVFTDKSEVIENLIQSGDIIDIHVK